MKICIAFSRGGHFREAMSACEQLMRNDNWSTFYLTYRLVKTDDLGSKTHFVTHPEHGFILRRLYLLVINFFQSLVVFLRERPDVVVSSGADVTLSIMLIAKLFGRKVIFIESGANVTAPSLTGRLIYRLADLFIIQWKEMQVHYPKAVYGGPLL